jgi:hypothetical protein
MRFLARRRQHSIGTRYAPHFAFTIQFPIPFDVSLIFVLISVQFLEYFFTESDATFYKSLGLNAIRIPFNYRHFEDDMNPRILKQDGFKYLDRVVDICARAGIYTILDYHAAAGGQNLVRFFN